MFHRDALTGFASGAAEDRRGGRVDGVLNFVPRLVVADRVEEADVFVLVRVVRVFYDERNTEIQSVFMS